MRRFIADASHELRTPLASIRGYAELTRRTRAAITPEVAHALSRVESEAIRMSGLVEELLLLARLDDGRPVAREPVDLTDLLVNTVIAAASDNWGQQLMSRVRDLANRIARKHMPCEWIDDPHGVAR